MGYLFYLVASSFFFAFGEYFSKLWATDKSNLHLFLAFISYSAVTAAWFPAISQKNHLAIVGTTWSILSLITTVIMGVVLFKERLTVIGWTGVVFAVLATALLTSNK